MINLLLIEDHAILAQALGAMLERTEDFHVLGWVETLQGAVDWLEDATQRGWPLPDVMLVDVCLPDSDGAAGVARLLDVCPSARAVVLTAASGVDVVARAVRAGASGLLLKTQLPGDLAHAIRQANAGESLFDPATLARVAAHLESRSDQGERVLTRREREVLELLARGATNAEIADVLFLSVHTVRNHLRHVRQKLGVSSQLSAVVVAHQRGLIDLPDRW